MGKEYTGKSVNGVPFDETGNVDIVTDIGGVPMLVVNSDYTGDLELGTVSKPYKNTQNSLDAYVGNGASNKEPEKTGSIIVIQKDDNIFQGSLAYAGLKLEISNGAILTTNPSSSDYVLDIDSDAILPTNPNYDMIPFTDEEEVNIRITIIEGGSLQSQKKLLKNRGTNNVSGVGKSVRFLGTGDIINIAESSVISASTKNLFSLNEDNQIGFFNGGATANVYIDSNISSSNSQIAYIGLNTKFYSNNNYILFGAGSVPFNSNTIPFIINGGQFVGDGSSINNEYNNAPTYSLINLVSIASSGLFYNTNAVIGGVCEYVFANRDLGSSTICEVILDNCSSIRIQTDSFFKSFMSSGIWNIKLTNCNFAFWGVDSSKIALIPSSLNTLGGQVVETLYQYATKAIAVSNGLFTGCAFTQKTDVSAVDLVAGVEYKITTVGTPPLGTLNAYFTATGSETGTGVGTLYQRETII